MGVVTVSTSRTPLGFGVKFLTRPSPALRRPCFLAFKTDGSKNQAFVTVQEPTISIPTESVKKRSNAGSKRSKKNSKKVKAVATEEASSCALEMDYNEVAAALESIYKLSPDVTSISEEVGSVVERQRRPRKKVQGDDEDRSTTNAKGMKVVVIGGGKAKRLTLDKRIALRSNKGRKVCVATVSGRLKRKEQLEHDVDRLVRDYSASTDLVSLDWKKMKIPPVLPSSEHTWLFKLMQPMKAIFEVKKALERDLGREPTDAELATSLNLSVPDMRRQVDIGRAARNKLIKHNLRLILFVINKYYQDFGNGSKFQDLCQAGVKGLITAIDRFEQKRGFRLSTYGLFWIRHAIIRSMTISNFSRVPFGIESVRQEIQREKLKLMFELDRVPTDEEIVTRVGLSPDRYNDIMRASKQVLSLNSKHTVTQEELIKGVTDVDGVGGDKRRQPALLRLALDDVLDSLKPKESMVIRQRYGLDGKGDRTLGEIAGNLNISREMVRKHEVKALMKLKHPARVDYLRRHIGKG